MYSFLFVFFALTLALYIEEIVFILKHFKISKRKKKTIWILAFHSVRPHAQVDSDIIYISINYTVLQR